MQPWKISVGLTTSLAGAALILVMPRLEYLAPYGSLILRDHWPVIAGYLGLALATVAALVYAVARAAGLADLGRRVALMERSARRGEMDPDLSRALDSDARGDWE